MREPRERAGEWGQGVGDMPRMKGSWVAVTQAQRWKGVGLAEEKM